MGQLVQDNRGEQAERRDHARRQVQAGREAGVVLREDPDREVQVMSTARISHDQSMPGSR
jgi:hypothetical protein